MLPSILPNKAALIAALVKPTDKVLDVGFWGQGTTYSSPHWPHRLLMNHASEVWGIDLDYDESKLPQSAGRYRKASAESFDLGDERFDVVFGGDIIEHLANPGLFLDCVARHLAPGGRLVVTTPNAFNIFHIAEKFTKREPTVNPDHTCYFNEKTIRQLLGKCGWSLNETRFLYSLRPNYRESMRKRVLNLAHALLAKSTDKFVETLVIVATPSGRH